MASSDSDVLPDAARVLPPAGQKVWIKAFKEAKLKGMPDSEASAFAWAAVKRAGYHKKSNGKWGKLMDAEYTVNGDDITFGVPFVKINSKSRTVSGFATLDNVDKAGDVLEADASKEAFAKWAGNIREMHEKKAVGRSISVESKEFKDESGETYNGIWITARISKGAEDTWQKVLDGTLSGFSVGGAVHEKERAIAKTADGERDIWRITKYSLNEVSLVDNPCNQLAMVSLVKSIDGNLSFEDVIDGEDVELEGESLEKAHSPGSADCCMGEIDNVLTALKSWRQRAIEKDQDSEVANISRIMIGVRGYKDYERYEHEDHERLSAAVNKTNESEGEPMAKTEEELQNNDESDTSVSDEFTGEQKSLLRKLAELLLGEQVTEPEAEATEISEELDKEGDVTSEMNNEEVSELVGSATEELSKSVDEKFEGIGEALTKIAEALETVAKSEDIEAVKVDMDAKIAELAGRIEGLETTGAVKKSGDVTEESLEKEDKGFWSDAIVPEFLKKA